MRADTMSTITFDTLHFANRLKSVGFTDEQAQVLIELQLSVINTTLEQLKQHRQLNDLSTTQTNRD
jgi:hypothetical protein